MSKKSNIKITILFVLSAGLIVTAMTTYLLTIYYRQVCFHILVGFCESIIEKNKKKCHIIKSFVEALEKQIYIMYNEATFYPKGRKEVIAMNKILKIIALTIIYLILKDFDK